MLYALLGFCAVIGAGAFCRYMAFRMSLASSEMSKLTARRLLDELRADDIAGLKEQNAVMRNLLLDIVENEASLVGVGSDALGEQSRRYKDRLARRRELYGEAVVLLDGDAAPVIRIRVLNTEVLPGKLARS